MRKYKPSDYKEIIHLVDMDVVYLREDLIFEDKTLKNFTYRVDGIHGCNRSSIIDRNSRKAKILNQLSSLGTVFTSVPYRVLYFSTNLEHVLHNEIQVDDREKMKKAEEFQDQYIEDLDAFKSFICSSDFSVNRAYKESWDFIKEGNNSIKRYTNLDVFLKEYL